MVYVYQHVWDIGEKGSYCLKPWKKIKYHNCNSGFNYESAFFSALSLVAL